MKKIWSVIDKIIIVLSLLVAVISLFISKNAFTVSEIALEITSKDTEPIIEMNIDYENDTIELKNKSHEYYQITNVNYGKVRFIGVLDDNGGISYVYLPENYTTTTLEHGHTVGTDMSDENIKKFNKKMKLSLDKDDSLWCQTDNINAIEETIINMCESQDCEYWGVSANYSYYYVEIRFKDSYGNRDSMYYVYKYEYGSTWQTYKVEEKEYINKMNEVYKEINVDNVISTIFSKENFKNIEETGYINFYYDVNSPLYKKVGKE